MEKIELKNTTKVWRGIFYLISWYVVSSVLEVFLASFDPEIEKLLNTSTYLFINWSLEAFIIVYISFAFLKLDNKVEIFFSQKIIIKDLIYMFFISILIWIVQVKVLEISVVYLPENFPANALDNYLNNYNSTIEKIIINFYLVIITPITEEIFLRGFIYSELRKTKSLLISIVIDTLIFIFFHPVLAWIPALIIINIALCFIYEKTKYLWAPILVHSILNLMEIIFG